MGGDPEHIAVLLANQSSPNNNVRTEAELIFNYQISQDPTTVSLILMQIAEDALAPIDIRQASLLQLKRVIPKYWSMGFPAFIGPPVSQEVKSAIRSKLLQLVTTTPNTKLRTGCSYAIVQIAASDYPDEWPELLTFLYNLTLDVTNETAFLGGFLVLNELFDDLITSEQFWNQSVGSQLTDHICKIVSTPEASVKVKISCVVLYGNILSHLRAPESFETAERKTFAIENVTTMTSFFAKLLEDSIESNNDQIGQISLRSHIYNVLVVFFSDFNKRISKDMTAYIFSFVVQDYIKMSDVYVRVVVTEESTLQIEDNIGNEPVQILVQLFVEMLQLINSIQHQVSLASLNETGKGFFGALIDSAKLSKARVEEYEANFNEFITDSSSLILGQSVRESTSDLLQDLNELDAAQLFLFVFQLLGDKPLQQDVSLTEALLFILESLFQNADAKLLGNNLGVAEILSRLNSMVDPNNALVVARVFVLLPRFFEKFENIISVDTFGAKALADLVSFASNSNCELVKAAAILSVSLFKQLIKVQIEPSKRETVVLDIFKLAYSILEDSEEDGLPALLEAISVGIESDYAFASKVQIEGVGIIDLILKIAFKDSANVQLVTDSSECLQQFLSSISNEDYLTVCEKSLPSLLQVIKNHATGTYSPDLDLTLELLGVIIQSCPITPFPLNIFEYAFPTVKHLLLISDDNQILQSGGEVFSNLITKASQSFLAYKDPETGKSGVDLILEIVSKFLSPVLSDSAAMNTGLIVHSLIQQFESYLSTEFLAQILEATVKRLVIAKEVVTVENLIQVFCYLVLKAPQDMINFLTTNIKLIDPTVTPQVERTGLEIILPIWFDSFEVTRGYEKIKQNALALAKIYSLGDSKVESLIVNGDIIPYDGDLIITRSMAQNMPDRYTRISASLKILKVLAGELIFQNQQPDANDYLPENVEQDDGDDDWEDMQDMGVPTYDKLKSYVDSDDEGSDYDEQNGDQGLKDLLSQFFKECMSKNLGHFDKFYKDMSDDEKKMITESVVF
ncbi:uncharacterized protein KQ657_000780 [Scheffersomyces spartinae]|uniref:Importin N-terminal domain-containing protein n=1 Tax=Scheffersomyces spartinae TaxID=45513 RepID=A0A9P8AI08_9ASCO|nr:uncharacterized protein KQ657_000780 [Scheffersomyces spartinae]KAG7193363.1 hypothetical protein KQ657_000780 [Scheffersomyces spartinae]